MSVPAKDTSPRTTAPATESAARSTKSQVAAAAENWRLAGRSQTAGAFAAMTAVLRAQRIYQKRADEVLRPYGLTASRWEILLLIAFSREEALALSVISRQLQLTPPTVTNTIDRLERGDLVVREQVSPDRRTTRARLTDLGRKTVSEASAAMEDRIFSQRQLRDPELDLLADYAVVLCDSLRDRS